MIHGLKCPSSSLCMLGFAPEKIKSVFFQSCCYWMWEVLYSRNSKNPTSNSPELNSSQFQLGNAWFEPGWRWFGQEKQNCCPLLQPSILPAAGFGVNLGKPRRFGVLRVMLCSARQQPEGGEVGPLSELTQSFLQPLPRKWQEQLFNGNSAQPQLKIAVRWKKWAPTPGGSFPFEKRVGWGCRRDFICQHVCSGCQKYHRWVLSVLVI